MSKHRIDPRRFTGDGEEDYDDDEAVLPPRKAISRKQRDEDVQRDKAHRHQDRRPRKHDYPE